MNSRNIVIIPSMKPAQPDRYLGTLGKIRVVGYAQVIKGIGAGLQIRKNIRRLIADRPDWELAYVTTDYCKTEHQDSTWRSFLSICYGIKHKCFDVLIIHSADDLKVACLIAEWLIPFCREYGVAGYIVHNDSLLSEFDFKL